MSTVISYLPEVCERVNDTKNIGLALVSDVNIRTTIQLLFILCDLLFKLFNTFNLYLTNDERVIDQIVFGEEIRVNEESLKESTLRWKMLDKLDEYYDTIQALDFNFLF